MSEKKILPVFLLCLLLGLFGVHRFYVGKIWTGVIMFFTVGGFLIWWIIDLIVIVVGSFTDDKGNKITQWT